MKRQLYTMLSLATMALCGTVSADPCCEPVGCDTCNPCVVSNPCCGGINSLGNITVWGDALYFQVASSRIPFAILDRGDGDFPVGIARAFCPQYHWGYRVGATLGCSCLNEGDVSIYYSHLDFKDRHELAAFGDEFLWIATVPSDFGPDALYPFADGDPAAAISHSKIRWNAVDGEFGYFSHQGCGNVNVRSHFGIHWADITVDHRNIYFGEAYDYGSEGFDSFIESHSRVETWGVGPRFGSDITLNVGCGVNLVGRGSVAVLVGRSLERYQADYSVDTDPVDSDSFAVDTCRGCTIIFPEFDAQLGFHYDLSICNWLKFGFEIGWEFRTYLQSIPRSYYLDDENPGNAAYTHDPFNLQGLYIRGILNF